MSIQLALGKDTNDLIKLQGGNLARVDEGRYVVQLVQNRLKTILGEWLLNPTAGWINVEDFVKSPDLFSIELRARQVILETTGIQTIDTMSLNLSQRILTLSFSATTIHGGIDVTVPWSL